MDKVFSMRISILIDLRDHLERFDTVMNGFSQFEILDLLINHAASENPKDSFSRMMMDFSDFCTEHDISVESCETMSNYMETLLDELTQALAAYPDVQKRLSVMDLHVTRIDTDYQILVETGVDYESHMGEIRRLTYEPVPMITESSKEVTETLYRLGYTPDNRTVSA